MYLLLILLILQVNEDRTKVKRIRPLPELKNVDERTVYVVGILTFSYITTSHYQTLNIYTLQPGLEVTKSEHEISTAHRN